WHAMDVSMWAGQKGYIEVLADGGWASLEEILFSDVSSGPPAPPNALLLALLKDEKVTGPKALAEAYQRLLRRTVGLWRDGQLAGRAAVAHRVSLLNDLLASPVLEGPAGAATDEESARLAARLAQLRKQVAVAEAALPAPRRGLALADGTAVEERIHIRGSP